MLQHQDARKVLMVVEWKNDPELRDARIREITLAHEARQAYVGFADVVHASQSRAANLENAR